MRMNPVTAFSRAALLSLVAALALSACMTGAGTAEKIPKAVFIIVDGIPPDLPEERRRAGAALRIEEGEVRGVDVLRSGGFGGEARGRPWALVRLRIGDDGGGRQAPPAPAARSTAR